MANSVATRVRFLLLSGQVVGKRRLTLDYGARYDRDNIASETIFSPRIGFAFMPRLNGRTVIRGGVGLFYDAIDSQRCHLHAVAGAHTNFIFGSDGQQIIGVPQRERLVL